MQLSNNLHLNISTNKAPIDKNKWTKKKSSTCNQKSKYVIKKQSIAILNKKDKKKMSIDIIIVDKSKKR